MTDLGHGQGAHLWAAWLIRTGRGPGGGGGQREEGQGEHGQGGEPVPWPPAADLVVVEASVALGGLERFLDRPAAARDAHQGGQRNRTWRPAQVKRQLAGGAVAADQQPPAGPSLQASPRPVVVTGPFRPRARGQ